MAGGGHLRNAQARAHLTGQTGEARAAVILAGVELSGCRTSGVGGNGATVHKRGNGRALRPPGVAVSTTVGSGASCGGCGHGHAMAGGEKLSAAVVTAATEGNRARGERGSAEELTARSTSSSVGSGRWRRRRIDERHPAAVCEEDGSMTAMQGVRGRLTRRRG